MTEAELNPMELIFKATEVDSSKQPSPEEWKILMERLEKEQEDNRNRLKMKPEDYDVIYNL